MLCVIERQLELEMREAQRVFYRLYHEADGVDRRIQCPAAPMRNVGQREWNLEDNSQPPGCTVALRNDNGGSDGDVGNR